MASQEELLIEIRDLLARQVQTSEAELARQRDKEALLEEQMSASLEMQRAQGLLYKRVVLIALPVLALVFLIFIVSDIV